MDRRSAVRWTGLVALALTLTVLPSRPPSESAAIGPGGSWITRVSAWIRASEYHFSPAPAGGWSAPNRAHGLRSRFADDGVEVVPRAGDDAWRLRLQLAAFGRDCAMRDVEPATPNATDGRIEYRRTDGLIEWYVNDARGIEQGFTFAHRPPGPRDHEVVLAMTLGGAGRVAPSGDPGCVTWLDSSGAPVLRYGGLVAWDARDRPVRARLAVEGDRLEIRVDDRDARYPVTIDPLMSAYAWSDEGQSGDDDFGATVATAGDVNDDGFSDILVGAPRFDGGQNDEGKLYLYLGSPAGPALEPSWTAESNASLTELGTSIATAGDVNGDGYDDIVAGAPRYGVGGGPVGEGWIFVWLGGIDGMGPSGTPGNADWTARGGSTEAHLGQAVASAGDVNRDGFDDVVAGAPDYESAQNEHEEGGIFLWLGSATGLGASGTTANADWRAESNQLATRFGIAVSSAGDVNGDGYDDVVAGWPYYENPNAGIAGRVLAWFGGNAGMGASGTPANADWLYENGDTRHVGWSVAAAGDVDGDGYGDVIVGAPEINPPTQGNATVFYGSAAGLGARFSNRVGVAGEHFGRAVDTAGDVNGDGLADVVIGAMTASAPDAAEGKAFVFQGQSSGLAISPAWTAEGGQGGAHFGGAVACAGDVNGDGYGDVVVGAESYDGFAADMGAAYLYFGAPGGVQLVATWSPDGDQTLADFGACVAGAGDLNGDGFGDVVVGAPKFDPGGGRRGRVYVFYGSTSGLPAFESWSADATADGADFGASVAGAGDVNGDGYDDLLIGAPHANGAIADVGVAALYFGAANGLGATADWTAEGDQATARFGVSVAGIGDLDGDGFADIAIGADRYDHGQADEGRVYVYHGSDSGPQGAPWIAENHHPSGLFGCAVAGAGDVNGDGFSDLVVGESGYDGGQNGEGRAYVYHGARGGLATAPQWTEERDQLFEHLGTSVAGAGDVNGDGYSDIIVGAPNFDGSHLDEGRAWVFLGSASGLSSSAAWFADIDQDGAYAGTCVGSAGDVNGDGFSDVIVGAPGYDGGLANEGKAWIYLGAAAGLAAASSWTAEGGQADAAFGAWVGPAGDVNGDGFPDVLVGAHRYDLGQDGEGRVWLHYGNGGDGADRSAQQRRTPNTLTVGLLGTSDSETSVRLRVRGRSAAGRGNVGLEWEVKPLGTPFDGTGLSRNSLLDTGGPGLAGSMILRSGLATGLAPGTLYHWRVRILTDSPRFPRSPWMTHPGNGMAEADIRTAGTALAAGDASAAVALALEAARPNPSAGMTALRFTLPARGSVDLAVFDLQGRRMASLARGVLEAGVHVVHWDGGAPGGTPAAAGTYFARLSYGGEVRATKLVRTP